MVKKTSASSHLKPHRPLTEFAEAYGLKWEIAEGVSNPGEPHGFHLVRENGKTVSPPQTIGENQEEARDTITLTAALKKSKRSGSSALPEHDSEILNGIARGPWASYWMDQREEARKPVRGDGFELAPRTPAWAKKWGKEVADSIVRMNGSSLSALYKQAVTAGYPHNEEHFGYHLGMQVTGAGVSYSDDCKLSRDAIKLPQKGFYR